MILSSSVIKCAYYKPILGVIMAPESFTNNFIFSTLHCNWRWPLVLSGTVDLSFWDKSLLLRHEVAVLFHSYCKHSTSI